MLLLSLSPWGVMVDSQAASRTGWLTTAPVEGVAGRKRLRYWLITLWSCCLTYAPWDWDTPTATDKPWKHQDKIQIYQQQANMLVLHIIDFCGRSFTCRKRGRLSLRADNIWVCAPLSCWRRAWGSSSTSTMRKSSCWALVVANRWLQCLTKQPRKNRL